MGTLSALAAIRPGPTLAETPPIRPGEVSSPGLSRCKLPGIGGSVMEHAFLALR